MLEWENISKKQNEERDREGNEVPGINHNYNQRARKLHQGDSLWPPRLVLALPASHENLSSNFASFKVGRATLHTSLFFHFFASFLARKIDSFTFALDAPTEERKRGTELRRKIKGAEQTSRELGTNTLSHFDELLRVLRCQRFRNFLLFTAGNFIFLTFRYTFFTSSRKCKRNHKLRENCDWDLLK